MLSAGSAFAVDDVTDALAVDDEITIDEPLAVDGEDQIVSANESTAASSIIINNSNLKDYVDESGSINKNITAEELIFEGTFENLSLYVETPFKITGYNASLVNPNILILSSNVTFSGFTINQTKGINSLYVAGFEDNIVSDVTVSDVTIDFVDNAGGADAIAIDVLNTDNFSLVNSVINYVGNTNGTYINNAVLISKSNRATISNNKFNLNLVSAYVNWVEEPAGSWNYVAYPNSEGIVVANTNGAIFEGNTVNVTYGDVAGSSDTIYAVNFKNSDNAVISGNDIVANGHTYVYGIQMNGNNFTISGNNIAVASDNYYANGIDIEGVASGVVENNVIDVKGVNSVYAVYSGMNYKDVKANYTNNTITGAAYNIFGFSLGDVESNVIDNKITLDGNYTTGIAYTGSIVNVADNHIVLLSSEVGNESIWESFGVEAVGVKVIKGNATITDNVIAGSGKGVSLTGPTDAKLEGNFINVVGVADKDAYAIYAVGVSKVDISNNTVDYQGTTKGAGVNNAVYIDNATAASISNNKFDLDLVSAYVNWVEEPAGSWNYVAYPNSEGIVVANTNGAIFEGNTVNVTYGDVAGSSDTIYAVNFKNSDNAVISGNDIVANGHTYVYGIQMNGNNFTISGNNIAVASDNYYACGIDIEGVASGVVENNVIDVKGVNSVYAVYSGMNYKDVKANYTNNTITGDAYNVFGFSLGDVESNVVDNKITLDGNYTTGIAYTGSIVNVADNHIVLASSEIGNESIWESFGVEAVGVKVIKGNATITNNVISTSGKGVSLTGPTDAKLEGNFINVVGVADKDAYAIYAVGVSKVDISNNTVDYQGTTNGTGVNNAVYIDNATAASISNNKFDLDLVSAYVNWVEEPAGSWNYVAYPNSEGIVVANTNGAIFEGNTVNVTYGDVAGSSDTIYAVNFKNSDNAVISGNDIVANGHTYVYGIQMNGNNFTISGNNIAVASDNYYACGIDIEGVASGVVENNVIDVNAINSAYAIYSGMNYKDVKANYTNNTITGDAYNVFGFSLGDVESNVVDNEIALDGNYTTGIAYKGSKLTVDNNVIKAVGSNVGNESIWESFGVENVGVKVVSGEATIVNNDIRTTGEYAVKVANTNSSVHDNYLISSGLKGDSSVDSTGDAEIYNNTPALKSILAASDVVMEVGDGSKFVAILKDENNNAIANKTVSILIGNETFNQVTDEKGTAEFNLDNLTVGNYSVIAKFDGEGDYAPISSDSVITVSEAVSKRIDTIIKVDAEFSRNATDFTAGERGGFFTGVLTDVNGNPLANKTVQIAVNGDLYNKTTDENGTFYHQINLAVANTYTYAIAFQGDDQYNAPLLASSKLTVVKKSTSIAASAKTFKSTAKTKKITVTLKTIKNAYDKKTYLKAGKKVTLKINGVTYTAKINAKGQATFSIKLTKKGKFTALIKFAGDKTYKASSKKITVTIK